MKTQHPGIKLIALFEASKGALSLLAGFGLLTLLHKDLQVIAQNWIQLLHIDAHKPLVAWLLERVLRIQNNQILQVSLAAIAYASIRMIEGYGLWFARHWAEKLAIYSGLIYLPFELYELVSGVTLIKVLVVALNVGIVLYMVLTLRKS